MIIIILINQYLSSRRDEGGEKERGIMNNCVIHYDALVSVCTILIFCYLFYYQFEIGIVMNTVCRRE